MIGDQLTLPIPAPPLPPFFPYLRRPQSSYELLIEMQKHFTRNPDAGSESRPGWYEWPKGHWLFKVADLSPIYIFANKPKDMVPIGI